MRYRKIERGGKEERERKEQESGKQNREDDIERKEMIQIYLNHFGDKIDFNHEGYKKTTGLEWLCNTKNISYWLF